MNTFPQPRSGHLLVLVAPRAGGDLMLDLSARLAQDGMLRVLDGGNRFNAYRVSRALVRLNHGQAGLAPALARIQVARAFTCYQMAAMLEQAPSGAIPTLVIDFLDTFYDQGVPLPERRRLLHGCLGHLRRLRRTAAVVASLRPPPPPHDDPTGLLDMVRQAADSIWSPEIPLDHPPLRLF